METKLLASATHSKVNRFKGCKAEITACLFGSIFLLTAFFFPPLEHKNHGSITSLVVQAGVLIWFGITFLIAEMVRRVCLLTEEVSHLSSHYEGSISKMLFSIFSSRNSSNIATLILLLALLFVSHLDPFVMVEIKMHWSLSIGIGGLYLIFISVVKITENLVLSDHVVALGQGLAYSYYYGFLKVILPAGLTEGSKCFRDRATHFEYEEKILLATKKLIILIPDTCFCTPSFQDMAPPGQIEKVKAIGNVVVSRAGMKARPYSSFVYLIHPEGQKKPIYVLLEMPAILYVLYEMNTVGVTNSRLTSFERSQQAQAFYSVLCRLLSEDPSCKDMYEIIYYNDQNINLAELIYSRVHSMQYT